VIFQVVHLWGLTGDTPQIRGESVEGVGSVQFNAPEYTAKALCSAAAHLLAPFEEILL
jgi:hypothetical protein